MQSSPITPAVQCQNVGAKMNLSFKSPHVHPPQSSLFFALLSLYLSRALAGSHWPNFRVTRCVCVWVCVWMWVWVWLCVCAWLFSINSTWEPHLFTVCFVLLRCSHVLLKDRTNEPLCRFNELSHLKHPISDSKRQSAPLCHKKTTWHVSLDLNNDCLSFSAELDEHIVVFSVMLQSLQSHEYLYYIQARVHTMW